MKKKTTRTYSISDNIYEEFMKIIERDKINKSKLIESWIKEFIEKNIESLIRKDMEERGEDTKREF